MNRARKPARAATATARIRSIESLALSILRLLEEEAMKEHTGQVHGAGAATVANFLLNEKRKALAVSKPGIPYRC